MEETTCKDCHIYSESVGTNIDTEYSKMVAVWGPDQNPL